MASITIYTTPTCGFCHMEMDWLKDKGITFETKDITVDQKALQEVLQKAGQPVTPVTDIDGTIIIGFDRPHLEAKLKEVGLLS